MLDNCPLSRPRNKEESKCDTIAIPFTETVQMIGLSACDAGNPELSEAVLDYLENNLSENTRRAYAADLKHFEEWGGVIPASEVMVANYLAAHAGKLTCATLERRLATLSKVHRMQGLANPVGTDLVRATMRGIKRKHGVAQCQAKPLLAEQLFEIVDGLGDSTRDVRDKALLLLGFSGAFRRSELVGINVEDIEWCKGGLIVHLRSSKTDQMKRGRLVPIRKTSGSNCPCDAVRNWLKVVSISYGALFRSINRHGKFSGKRLSAGSISRLIKGRVAETGLDNRDYSGHSLRAGFVTSAAQAGIPTWSIRQQTGHASEMTLQTYIRNHPESIRHL